MSVSQFSCLDQLLQLHQVVTLGTELPGGHATPLMLSRLKVLATLEVRRPPLGLRVWQTCRRALTSGADNAGGALPPQRGQVSPRPVVQA